MSEPLISIIVPVYNIAPYLTRCIDSLLAQTYTNLEIITVDDGSTDGSGNILDDYSKRDSRIKVIHKINGGVSSARNDALNLSTGDYIGFVDGDDYVEPDMFEFLLNAAVENDADIAHCGYKMIMPDNSVKNFYGTKQVVIQNRNKGLLDLICGSQVEPACWNKLYKSVLFDDVRFNTGILSFEDLLINYFLFRKAEKSVYIDECKYHYIKREGSASMQSVSEKLVYHPIKVRKIICDECETEDEDIKKMAHTMYVRMNISIYTIIVKNDACEFFNQLDSIRQNIRNEKKYISGLKIGGRIHAYLILYFPWLCRPLFRLLYSKNPDKR